MRLIYCFLLLATSVLGQDRTSSVPTTLYVENSYTLQPEEGVELRFELRQPNGRYYRVATRYTNADGMVSVSLQPNLSYSITSKKSDYYTQLTLLETNDLARLSKNRFNISLRPKSCYRLQGQVERKQMNWTAAYFTMTNLATQKSQQVNIDQQGNYYTCGKCGETYVIAPFIDDQAQQLDTLYLSPSNCQERRNPLLRFNLELQEQPAPAPIIPEQEVWLETGDSLVVKNLSFEGKTKKLGAEAQKALEELVELLKKESDSMIELLVHTDARKSERYNWLLAQKRGLLLEKYMKEQGIASERYTIIPVGEAQILNECTNNKRCSAAQHAVNNRIEIVRHPVNKEF